MSFSSNILKKILPQDMRMSNFVRDERVKPFVAYMPILSFFSANLVMVFFFDYFFQISTSFELFSIFLYALGILVSFTVIKTSLFLKFKDTAIEREGVRERLPENSIEKYNSCPQLGWVNNYLILRRLFFFNILNDLFVLTLFWSSLFFIFYFVPFSFGWIPLPQGFNVTNFVALITLIGVIAGFFQLYISNYKESVVQRIQNTVSKHLKNCLKEISPFIEHLKEDSRNNELAEKVEKFLKNDENVSQKYMKRYKTVINSGGRRDCPNLTIYNLLSPATSDPINIFRNIDYYAGYELSEPERGELRENYRSYFDLKRQQFINELLKMDLNGVRKVVFSNIIFFDETFSDYISLNFESSNHADNLDFFDDFLQDYFLNCVFEFLDILYNIQEIK